jgi:hypothetical protein
MLFDYDAGECACGAVKPTFLQHARTCQLRVEQVRLHHLPDIE